MNRQPQPSECPLEGDEITFTHIPVEGPEEEEVPPIQIRFYRDYGQSCCEALSQDSTIMLHSVN